MWNLKLVIIHSKFKSHNLILFQWFNFSHSALAKELTSKCEYIEKATLFIIIIILVNVGFTLNG